MTRGHYLSPVLWDAVLELASEERARAIVGPYEPALRAIPARVGDRLFALGLYVYAPAWERVVAIAVDAIARHVGEHPLPRREWSTLSEDRLLARATAAASAEEYSALDSAYWAVRQAWRWKDTHPGVLAVARASEHDAATRTALRTWLDEVTDHGSASRVRTGSTASGDSK